MTDTDTRADGHSPLCAGEALSHVLLLVRLCTFFLYCFKLRYAHVYETTCVRDEEVSLHVSSFEDSIKRDDK